MVIARDDLGVHGVSDLNLAVVQTTQRSDPDPDPDANPNPDANANADADANANPDANPHADADPNPDADANADADASDHPVHSGQRLHDSSAPANPNPNANPDAPANPDGHSNWPDRRRRRSDCDPEGHAAVNLDDRLSRRTDRLELPDHPGRSHRPGSLGPPSHA